jgi:hypothetical protein
MENSGKLFPPPVNLEEIDEFGVRPIGTRSDSLILDKLRTAIQTGRVSLDEVRTILEKMFGPQYRHAWDETAGPILKAAGQN